MALTLLGAGLLVLARRRNRAGALLLLVLAALIAAPAAFAQATTVTNVAFTQGPYAGGTQVDITYNLGGTVPCAISVMFSKDGGATFPTTLPLAHLSGDVGPGVTPGTKHIAWNIAADYPNEDMPYARIRVTADESGGPPAEVTILLPGGVPLVLVRIPAGSFQMGSPDTERSRWYAEGPVHTVTIYDFYMGKYELTQAQWLAVMPQYAPTWNYGLGDNYPAYYISWDDARNFVTALNNHITATSQGPATMRLPSEAEWEYACRAGTQTRFYFGDSLGVGDDCENEGTRSLNMWFCGNNSPRGSRPVGGKLANAFGLYDMSGNLYEWCEDDYHGSYTGAPTNGSAWIDSPRASDRLFRGGGWGILAGYCRSALRDYYYPSFRSYGIGFRLASVR